MSLEHPVITECKAVSTLTTVGSKSPDTVHVCDAKTASTPKRKTLMK